MTLRYNIRFSPITVSENQSYNAYLNECFNKLYKPLGKSFPNMYNTMGLTLEAGLELEHTHYLYM